MSGTAEMFLHRNITVVLHVIDMVIPMLRDVASGLVLREGWLLLVLWCCVVQRELMIGGWLLLWLVGGLLVKLFACGCDGGSIFGLLVQARALTVALATGRFDMHG